MPVAIHSVAELTIRFVMIEPVAKRDILRTCRSGQHQRERGGDDRECAVQAGAAARCGAHARDLGALYLALD